MKELPGKITISRIQSNRRDDMIAIKLVDESSGCRVIEIEMTPEVFSLAITGLSFLRCQFHLYQEAPVGKVREVKQEPVFVPDCNSKMRDRIATEAVEAHNVGGWKGRVEDAQNSHRVLQRPALGGKSGSWYNVTFIRFVEPELASQEEEMKL